MSQATISTTGRAASRPPLRSRSALASPRKRISKAAASVILALIGVVFLVPLAWIGLSAFNPSGTVAVKVPTHPTMSNFSAVFTADQTLIPLWNSTLMSFGTAVLTVGAAVLAAYPLSRYQMRFGKPFMYGILFGTCLPITAMMVPVYSLFVYLHMLDSIPGTIFFMSAAALPMAIWMMKNFIDSVPIALEEAAWVDGAGSMKALAYVVVPLMRPGIAVVFIFVFTVAWGNFFVPFVLLSSPDHQPAAVAIYNFFGTYGAVAYGKLAAFSILYSTPALVLYLLVQRFSGGSFAMAGAVKG